MARSFTTTISLNGHQVEGTRWEWGGPTSCPEDRRGADGWGTTVETAAVIQLMDLVVAGEVTAEQVRTALTDVAEAINEECDVFEFDETGAMIGYKEGKEPSYPDARPVRSGTVPPQRLIGHTYLVGIKGSPFVKIGYTGLEPKKRLAALQTGHPEVLTLLGTWGGNQEGALHRHFAEYRVRGEWFDLTSLGDPVEAVEAAIARKV